MRIFLISLFVICLAPFASAQIQPKQRPVERPERNKGNGILTNLSLSFGIPAADLKKRFGAHQTVALCVDYITQKNLIVGLEGQILFGNSVKENPLTILLTPEGDIIGNDQTLVDFGLRERGGNVQLRLGYLFGIAHQRSGLLTTIGVGGMWHKIRITDNTKNMVQLDGDYIKGYDRLTGGLSLTQFVGYQHLVRYSGLNWFAGFESTQGFTKPQRDYDFSTMSRPQGNRTDVTLGFKIGMTLPFIGEDAPEEIYY
jgi:hypothetical protein